MSTASWKIGHKRSTQDWGTAETLGALDERLIISESFGSGIPETTKDHPVGSAAPIATYQGNVVIQGGNLVEYMRYEGMERILAQIMGSDVVTNLDTNTEEHVMDYQPSNFGNYGTLALDKGLAGPHGTDPWEYPSVKWFGFQIGHDVGKAQMTSTGTANGIRRIGGPAGFVPPVNGVTEFAALTAPSKKLIALFSSMRVLIKEVTGSEGNLADPDDRLCVTSMGLNIQRPVAADPTSCNDGEIDEPPEDGEPTLQLTIGMQDYTSVPDVFVKDAQHKQPGRDPKVYKGSVIWTGAQIPGSLLGTSLYRIQFDIPNMVLSSETSGLNASGPSAKTPPSLVFDLNEVNVAPNGSEWDWATVANQSVIRATTVNTNAVAMAA